jgi:hypothetical protein
MSDKPLVITQERSSIRHIGSITGIGYKISTKVILNPSYVGPDHVRVLLNPFVKRTSDRAFLRYATIADLGLLSDDETKAKNNREPEFRDSAFDIVFDNLNVAINATSVINDAINNIVTLYLDIYNKFVGSSSAVLPYSSEIDTLRDQYINAYKASKQVRIDSENSQAAVQTEFSINEAKFDILQESKTDICNLKDILSGIASGLPTVLSKYSETLVELINQYKLDEDSDYESGDAQAINRLVSWLSSEQLGVDSSYNDVTSQNGLTIYAQILAASIQATTLCTQYTSKLSQAESALDTSDSELKNSVSTKEVSAALEQKALADLSTYCPDLDPSSV